MKRTISIESPAVAHGFGLFETMLVTHGTVPFADAHHLRLARTAARLRLPAPPREAFDRAVAGQLRSITIPESAMRVMWLAESTEYDDQASWRLTASWGPIPPITLRRRARGRAVTLPRDVVRSLPFAKSTSWLTASLALRDAIAAGADEGFFVDRRGRILEGTSTNVFAIDRDRLLTAPLDAGVLPGVVREWVIENASAVGWKVVEQAPTPEDILGGAFMTSSLTKLAPVRMLGGSACAVPGPRFADLKRLLQRQLRQRSAVVS